MTHVRIKKGLDVPITGEPRQEIDAAGGVQHVALLGADFNGMKPTMLVQAGDRVALGQAIFEDKKTPGVVYTAPGAGEVVDVYRGAKRAFQSIVIRLDGDAVQKHELNGPLETASGDDMRKFLIASGLWTGLRTRPYSKVPAVDATPHAIFVNAMDSNPLALDPTILLREREQDFRSGLLALSKLGADKIFVCSRTGTVAGADVSGVSQASFEGPHPAGLPGTHMHFLAPVSATRTCWHIGLQDVCAIGRTLQTGVLDVERIVAVGGPAAKNPRLLRTRLGASTRELAQGELAETNKPARIVSGSILNGRAHADELQERLGFLGRYDQQVSLLFEGPERDFLGWHAPGSNKYSIKNAFVSALSRSKRFAMSTNENGSPRAMVPIGSYEKVMPLDILATQLLRALLSKDPDQAQQLGALELDEEDLGLCTFVCPGKSDYGPLLRAQLTTIEREG